MLGIGPVLLGVALARRLEPEGSWNVLLNLLIIFCVIFIQVATHFFNDSLDWTKGVDSPHSKGPKRAVQLGLMSTTHLLWLGGFCLLMASLLGIYLVLVGGWPIFIMGVVSLSLAYLYTGGPWPLSYTGWADLFVLLFFGILPVNLVFYLNTKAWGGKGALISGLACGLLALSLLVLNNLRDQEKDKKAKKNTLVVRFGRRFGLIEWAVAHYGPYLLVVFCFVCESWWFMGVFALLPLSFYIQRLWGLSPLKEKELFSLHCLHYVLFVLLFCIFLTTT